MNQQANDLLMGAPVGGHAEAAARTLDPRHDAGEEGLSCTAGQRVRKVTSFGMT